MPQSSDNSNPPGGNADSGKKRNPKGYPLYPASDDIYNRSEKEGDIDPEHLSRLKVPNEDGDHGMRNEKDFDDVLSGEDLDVPGSELDDEAERMGNEDEENNYYSIGGDNHNDLEEDQGT
jgi:hypothetical protein